MTKCRQTYTKGSLGCSVSERIRILDRCKNRTFNHFEDYRRESGIENHAHCK